MISPSETPLGASLRHCCGKQLLAAALHEPLLFQLLHCHNASWYGCVSPTLTGKQNKRRGEFNGVTKQ